jgi:hypothetical protein
MLRNLAICLVALLTGAGTVSAQSAASRSTTPTSAARSSPATPSAPNLASNQFTAEAEAKSHCPTDTVVWVNLGGSKAYHLSGDRYYGKTKKGAYMCQKEADQSGYHTAGGRATAAAGKSTSTEPTK